MLMKDKHEASMDERALNDFHLLKLELGLTSGTRKSVLQKQYAYTYTAAEMPCMKGRIWLTNLVVTCEWKTNFLQ